MKIILFIDTSNNIEIKVGIIRNEKKYIKRHKLNKQKAQAVLLMIEKCLKDHKLTIKDITKININSGPGSFTGIRVGLAVANTLAFLLKIPINKNPLGKMAEPVYSKFSP